MRRTSTTTGVDREPLVALADRIGITVAQAELGLALMETGNGPLINDVIRGHLSVTEALAIARRGTCPTCGD
jgi:hypothetical protein